MVEEDGVGERQDEESRPRRGTVQVSVNDLADLAKERLSATLGKKLYGVAGLSRNSDGYLVEVELIEEEHIISNSDLIGLYEVQVDREGNLVSWSRKGLRQRG